MFATDAFFHARTYFDNKTLHKWGVFISTPWWGGKRQLFLNRATFCLVEIAQQVKQYCGFIRLQIDRS